MIHSSIYQPRVIPYNGDITSAEMDRIQELTGTITLNRTKIQEVGRDGIVGFRNSIPNATMTARQLEYGSLEFWRKISNKSDATTTINLTDFRTSAFDLVAYITDQDGTFLGTAWYPEYRCAGFGLNIGDPDALIERSFNFVGENAIMFEYGNKYFIEKRFDASGGTPETFNVTNPTPAEDPDNSGQYILRVLRVRGTTTTAITYTGVASTTTFAYNSGTGNLTTHTLAGDVIKIVYSAASYVSGGDFFVENDSDVAGLAADTCTILLATGNTLTRLQSVAVDVTYDRNDIREIGNKDVVARTSRDTTVRCTLGRILETWSLEEVLRGVGGFSYGKIDVREFLSSNTLLIRNYSDNAKGTFLMGYKFTSLSPVSVDTGAPVADNVSQGVVLEGQDGVISSVLATIT